MRTIIKTFFLLLLPAVSIAQTDMTAEQLKKELAAHPQQDTIRVNLLIANVYADLTADERIKLAAEALAISRKTGYRRGEGYALANLGYFNVAAGNRMEGDSLLRSAESFAVKSNNPELIAFASYRIGTLLFTKGDNKCLDYLLKAEQIFERRGSYWLLSHCQRNIASHYKDLLSNYPLAMEYSLKSIRSAEKANSPLQLSNNYIVLGSLYSLLGDNNSAIVWLKKAETEMSKVKRINNLYVTLQNALGEAYRLSGRYTEAIYADKQAIKLSTSPLTVTINESNLADIYLRMDSLSLAFQYAFRSLPAMKKAGDNSLLGWIYGILGRAYLKKAMPDSSIYFAQQGLDSSIKSGTIEFMRDNAEALANAYAFKKDFANAYRYHLQYVNYRDSMLNTEVKNKTALLQYNSDMGKKEAQITDLNQQRKAQRSFLVSALIVLALILITAGLLLRNNRQKQKANKLLQQSYNNVEQLGEIGRKVNSSLDVKQIIGTVYQNVNQLMDAAVFGIGLYKEGSQVLEYPATFENGEVLPFYTNSLQDENRFGAVCFNAGKEINIGNLDEEYKDHIQKITTPKHGGQPESIIFLPLTAKEKKLGVITVQSFKKHAYSDYHLYMLRNIANYASIAIDNAESYETLNETLGQLQDTQKQLIQSEKMASLGELTAGIAHEIQNPLNFVNNFSEVNTELVEELKEELTAGNMQKAISLADGIKENEQKINFHGKRADAIVKGMLQHSRASSGKKEPTDINALADEYLRLSYHGLRAKDKSFNATMETNFDAHIGMINTVPQDIGRVLLNLFTNAFYSVTEKKKQLSDGYHPTVSVNTKRLNDKIEIRVKDNGNGIPQTVLDKIYQPFFTTKPTGEGTGLGLSMTYDIITKGHSGNIQVDTTEGEGAEFIITLPFA